MAKETFNPEGMPPPVGPYSNAVASASGRMVFVAGQVAYDAEGKVVGKGDVAAQTRQVMENIKLALEAAGATFEDVVKVVNDITDIPPAEIPTLPNTPSPKPMPNFPITDIPEQNSGGPNNGA